MHAALARFSGSRAGRGRAKLFFAVLALVTIIPVVTLPFCAGLSSPSLNSAVFGLWVLTGYGHVMSTVWFGLDREYRPVIATHRMRMLGSLAIVPAATTAIALSSAGLSAWIFAGYLGWVAYHYHCQNYGILSFAAAHDGFGPLPRQVRWIVNLTACAGGLALVTMPSIYPQNLIPGPLLSDPFISIARPAALLCFIAAGLIAAYLVVSDRRLRQSPTVLLFLGLTTIFFLPSLLPGGGPVAFMPYAMAHGAQYLMIMSITARGSSRGWRGVVIYAALAVLLGFVAVSMRTVPWAQLYVGIVIWHFLVDARLWRLRDPAVRPIVKGRFDFIFGGSAQVPSVASQSPAGLAATLSPAVAAMPERQRIAA